jgi:hypothetical protein
LLVVVKLAGEVEQLQIAPALELLRFVVIGFDAGVLALVSSTSYLGPLQPQPVIGGHGSSLSEMV